MKKIYTILVLLFVANISFCQSNSYLTFKEKFRGRENVVSLSASGFLTRTMLMFAGEHDVNKAIRDVRKVRMTVVPKSAFRAEDVTVSGFIRYAKKDNFEELFSQRGHGEDVILLQQEKAKKKGPERYLLLIDDKSEVVLFELTGYIDQEQMRKNFKKPKRYYQQEI